MPKTVVVALGLLVAGVLLVACEPGETLIRFAKNETAIVAAVNDDTLYALTTAGRVLRLRTQTGEAPFVPVNVSAPGSLAQSAYASRGAGYFIADKKILRVLGFENSIARSFDLPAVSDAFHVAAIGTTVYIATEKDGLARIDEASTTVAVVDATVRGPIAVDDTYVYFVEADKFRRTSRKNGSRDPLFSADMPAGKKVRSITRAGDLFAFGVDDDSSTASRRIFVLSPTKLIVRTDGAADAMSPIIADAVYAYFCAFDGEGPSRFARLPVGIGKVQIFSGGGHSDCPLAMDATWIYFAGRDGLRRVKKSALPAP